MTDPRYHCAIVGCKRTYKCADADDADNEVICGPHWRAVKLHRPELARLHKQAKAAWRKLWRLWNRPAPLRARKLYRAVNMARHREHRRWTAIKVAAQAMQDGGYFAPSPRQKRAKAAPAPKDTRRDGFEENFQRLKLMQRGTP